MRKLIIALAALLAIAGGTAAAIAAVSSVTVDASSYSVTTVSKGHVRITYTPWVAPPNPPTAAFTYSPASPVTGSPVHFDGTTSTCPGAPCSYTYVDTANNAQLNTDTSSPSFDRTFQATGTKHVRLTVADSSAQTAVVSHDVIVSAVPPPPPGPPANTAPPTISGTPQVGQTLTANRGTWTNSPTGYAYAWSDGATGATDTLAAGDEGQMITVAVTATNSAGSTTATSSAVGPVLPAGSGGGGCDLNATTSTFAAQVSAATAGQTLCLATGNYGTWAGTSKAITIKAADSASPAIVMAFHSGGGFTLDGFTSIAGVIDGTSHDITVRNSTFKPTSCTIGCLDIEGGVSHIVIDHNDLTYPYTSSSGGPNSKIFLGTNGSMAGAAVTISNNTIENGDLDGIHTGGSGVLIQDNRIANLCDRQVNHTDNIQFEGGSAITIEGNYIYESQLCFTQGITSYDAGTHGVQILSNVVDIPRDWAIEFYVDDGSVIAHNTLVWHPASYSEFGTGTGIISIDHKTGQACGSGTVVRDNVADVGGRCPFTASDNTLPSTVSYVGGAPGASSTYPDLFLAASSPGQGTGILNPRP